MDGKEYQKDKGNKETSGGCTGGYQRAMDKERSRTGFMDRNTKVYV